MTHAYYDSISIAAHHAFDLDTPVDLMPLTIVSEAHMLAGLDSDRVGCSWD
ncbi:MAG: hypothetical protein V9G11_05200 [Bifidobacterium adolescentis]|nr:hypothetical protein [Comamonadaceae bacterium]